MRRLICWLFGHTDPRLISVVPGVSERWECLDCHATWIEHHLMKEAP